jgi:hypothetical protein
MAKLHARPSNQYRYEHYDPWLGCSGVWGGTRSNPADPASSRPGPVTEVETPGSDIHRGSGSAVSP